MIREPTMSQADPNSVGGPDGIQQSTYRGEERSQDRVSSSADAADSDDDTPRSLLLGPRSTAPYIHKRDEQYMSKEQTEHFRRLLLAWKKDLIDEIDRTVAHMKNEANAPSDNNDRATQEEEMHIVLLARDRERKVILAIDQALQRLTDGEYGYCAETGEKIGIRRLEARPIATLCVEAQERLELRTRQFSASDSSRAPRGAPKTRGDRPRSRAGR
jgi:DnaK suppressor protein